MKITNAVRLVLRGLGWGVVGVLSIALLVLAAWVVSNIGDAQPRPRPAELALPTSRVADGANAAYAFMGLLAEAGRDPVATGRALREAERAWMALPPAGRASEADGHATRERALAGPPLALPKGPPLHCETQGSGCDAAWLAEAQALAAQRAGYGALGERCDKLLAGPFEFEELLPVTRGLDAPLMKWQPMVECSRWLRSGAMVALAQGRRAEALAWLERAHRLQGTLVQGAQTLVGHMVSSRVARSTLETMAAAALREPALAEALAPWLEPPLDTRAAARRWMVLEADFQRAAVEGVRDSAATLAATGEAGFFGRVGGSPLSALGDWLTTRGVGFHPERTLQKIDERWLQGLSRLALPWPALIEAAAADERALDHAAGDTPFKWRNTFGELLLDVARPSFLAYLARHADHELHREATALVLGLQRQRVAPAARAEAARQWPGLSEPLRQRMSWSADGRTLTVRSWQADTRGARFDPQRDSISFAWPP
ncbi:MAG: hypothetical protein JNL30_09435 [Rubrivivax sp.]|nr:hypothetical protein [Rubrivivax sp.]